MCVEIQFTSIYVLMFYVCTLLKIKGAAFNQSKTIGPKEGNPSVIKKGRTEAGLIWKPGEVQTR